MVDTPGAVPIVAPANPLVTDLVLEGGGVKGIGLVGALEPLGRAGYSYARVAGTSAGALVAAVVAAMQQRNEPIERLADIAQTLDYQLLRDRAGPGKWIGRLGVVADALSVIVDSGAYRGDYLRDWVKGVLAEFDVHTFADLRVDDPGGDGLMHHRYRLVVIASDISRRRLVHLPWDYEVYGLDPDEQLVCDAVRASASTPYLFTPVQLSGKNGTSTLVDGGLLSDYPISVFDRMDEQVPRWPTIGIRLDALRLGSHETNVQAVTGPVDLGVAMIATAIEGNQAAHVLEPCNIARSVFVDTSLVTSFDFDITQAQRAELLAHGRQAAEKFLAGWDYTEWLRHCRGVDADTLEP